MDEPRYCGQCGVRLPHWPGTQPPLQGGICPRCGATLSSTGDVLLPAPDHWSAHGANDAHADSPDAVTLATLQQAARAAYEHATTVRLTGNRHEAEVIEETTLQVLRPLVTGSREERGWLYTTRLVFDTGVPLLIDAMQAAPWPLTRVRLAALLAVPAVGQVTALTDSAEAIRGAIRAGMPLYNAGDSRRCAITYWATAVTLAHAPRALGVGGLSRALRPLEQALATTLTRIGDDARAIDDFAWWMRHALDAALAIAQE